ncbi:peptide/nickel transport system substrate-binding protein [Actinoallomurus bryophytorum]|uniref:Peptide/nickel transport system substrate-binding protein n=2 Tax=Actinoallomurus bryophytorum TaxID=1490222 RepID=A0A543CWL4_9ACTN|nr:peptide/nickel transport system substrate-binding protein [Actinoallomurus bryophytorum]
MVLVLGAAGCGGGWSGPRTDASFDDASVQTVGASTARGGTLRLLVTDAPISLDPGNIGLAYGADLARLYARSLVTYAPEPGAGGLRVVPDLAEGLGRASDGGRTWTYRLRSGVTFEDGTPVRARDVKYAVARSNYSAELTDSPRDLRDVISGTYWGPYLDPDLDHFTGVTTPDDRTVVFHLKRPFADFDQLAASPQTAPVPKAADTKLHYERHPVSTGPYRFERHVPGESLTLVRNPEWSHDPNRAALPDRIEVTEKVAAADVDARLLAGTADADLAGAGVLPQTRATIFASRDRRARADDPLTGLVRYAMLPAGVKPMDDLHCRRAVQYAIDRSTVQAAYGGPLSGSAATNVLPPTFGFIRSELYPRDLARARQELKDCGRPSGFTTAIAVRDNRPGDAAAARALSRSLGAVGISTRITSLSAFKWGSTAGSPAYVHAHGLGIVIDAWAANYPSGYAFLAPITGTITKTGNHNIMELRDPVVKNILTAGERTTDRAGRAAAWAEADHKVMEDASLVPLIYERTVLYRPASLRNVRVNPAYGTYDLAALGAG